MKRHHIWANSDQSVPIDRGKLDTWLEEKIFVCHADFLRKARTRQPVDFEALPAWQIGQSRHRNLTKLFVLKPQFDQRFQDGVLP